MTAFPITEQSPVEHAGPLPSQADVAIIGGGVIGVATAYYLARKGRKVVLLEKGRIAGEQSSRNWGWVRQTGRDAAELPIMIEANRLWPELQRDTNEDLGLVQSGLTYLAHEDSKLAEFEAFIELARAHGVDSRILSAEQTAQRLPGASRRYLGALHTPSDYRAEPWQAVPGLARAAARAGAVIIEHCAVRGLDRAGGAVAGVVTEQGRVAADQVLVAGGAWSSLFLRHEGVRLPQISVRATVVATDPVDSVHEGGAADDRIAFRRRVDGGYTLAPSGFHELYIGPDALRAAPKFLAALLRDPFGRVYRPAAPKGFPDAWGTARTWALDMASPFEAMRILNPAPNARWVARLLSEFMELFPGTGPVTAKAQWAGMIDAMPDVVPVVDAVADLPGLWVGTGMSGHGFGIGPAFGRILADRMTGGTAGHDMARFRFSRFTGGSRLQVGPGL